MDKADLAGFRLSTLKSDVESGQISLARGTRGWGPGQLPALYPKSGSSTTENTENTEKDSVFEGMAFHPQGECSVRSIVVRFLPCFPFLPWLRNPQLPFLGLYLKYYYIYISHPALDISHSAFRIRH